MSVRIFYWRRVGERVECVVHNDAPDEGGGGWGGQGGRKVVGVGGGGGVADVDQTWMWV